MAKFRSDRFTSTGGEGTRLYDPNEDDKGKGKDKSKGKGKGKDKTKGKKTAAERSALIKLAATLPVNSEDRRVLLASLTEDDG